MALFEAATVVRLGNGERTRFWHWWLDGTRVEDIAPNLKALVPARKAKERTVKEIVDRTSQRQHLRSSSFSGKSLAWFNFRGS
jgi:hypothetical protein